MSTQAQQTANAINSQSSTGPTSEAGRATSSKNALKHGLFSTADFILPGEQPFYDHLVESLESELAPVGILENTLVAEIRRATWRLRRCSLMDEWICRGLRNPILEDFEEKTQLSVDRARTLYNRLLLRCQAELRKLQAERRSREAAPVEVPQAARTGTAPAPISKSASFCKNENPQPPVPTGTDLLATPRNAVCNCGSGQKYKRCCGRNAPAILHAA